MAVPHSSRRKRLAGVPGLAALPQDALAQLDARLREKRFPPQVAVISQGDIGDDLYLIVEGQAEVSVREASGVVPLATLGPGEIFGEVALLAPGAERTATVTTVTPLVALALAGDDFRQLLEAHPESNAIFERAAREILSSNFLKLASPFAALDAGSRRRLAGRLEPIAVAVGDAIVRQGEPGDACYLVRSGRVEVVASQDGPPERRLATLGPGAIFGEAALLIDAPRNATVRALEPTELLALHRADLLDVLGAARDVAAGVLEFVHLRARPRSRPGIIARHHLTAEGEAIAILKDPVRHTYYRLSLEGWFIWEQLDGRRSLRDLTMDYFVMFRKLAPQAVAQIVAGLTQAGFIESHALRADVIERAFPLTPMQRAMVAARRVLEWQLSVRNIDKHVARWYKAGIQVVYTRAGQAALAALSLAGLGVFFANGGRGLAAIHDTPWTTLLLLVLPAYLASIVVHEAGHAFTTKAFGYEVPRAGIGWYWFTPVAFVDTSDIWLAGKWPRIAVSVAGPYMNLVLGSAAALICLFVARPVVVAALWLFALLSYLTVVFNANPLLEYDGYYVLMDWLDRPNLRVHALAWLGQEFPKRLRAGNVGGHKLELLYGAACVVYIGAMGALTVWLLRMFATRWMDPFMSERTASTLAWGCGAVVIALTAMSVASDLRRPLGTAGTST